MQLLLLLTFSRMQNVQNPDYDNLTSSRRRLFFHTFGLYMFRNIGAGRKYHTSAICIIINDEKPLVRLKEISTKRGDIPPYGWMTCGNRLMELMVTLEKPDGVTLTPICLVL